MIELNAKTCYVDMGESAATELNGCPENLYVKSFGKERPGCQDHVEDKHCSQCCGMLLTNPRFIGQRDSNNRSGHTGTCKECQSPCRCVAELLEAGLL